MNKSTRISTFASTFTNTVASTVTSAVVLLAAFTQSAHAVQITMATSGSPGGTYNRIVGDICKEINQSDIGKCVTQPSKGSVENMQRVNDGRVNIGVVQSDVLAKEMDNHPNVMPLMGLYTETVLIVARKDANIRSITDFTGKRINLGPEGSGVWDTSNFLLKESNVMLPDLESVSNLSPYGEDGRNGLCNGSFDALIYIGGTPALALHSIVSACEVDLIGLPDELIEKLTTEHNYFYRATIPANTYHGSPQLESIGVNAILIANKNTVSNETAGAIVGRIVEKLSDIKNNVKALGNTNAELIVSAQSILDFHPGAKAYFIAQGYLENENEDEDEAPKAE
ncbi:TAXI family TRAP transporter solute-binding subunit [Ostreibacterium oceani]|uniref:TAXI family TRAP transporter solute-binding subunit n=1 Tax=Ostreibacterium oceani TaxID=2654998 RepID=UPI00128D76EF|nr:TAXI family TRAP transporter solute-binding subunit [Ostreibacterium oceani]